jgi:hypothetical protein
MTFCMYLHSLGWTLASLSDDSADETLVGGGRLHVWRMTDLLHKDFSITTSEFTTQAARAAQPVTAAAATAAPSASPLPSSPSHITPMSDGVGGGSRSASAINGIGGESSDPTVMGETEMDLPPPDDAEDTGDVAPMVMDM